MAAVYAAIARPGTPLPFPVRPQRNTPPPRRVMSLPFCDVISCPVPCRHQTSASSSDAITGRHAAAAGLGGDPAGSTRPGAARRPVPGDPPCASGSRDCLGPAAPLAGSPGVISRPITACRSRYRSHPPPWVQEGRDTP